MSVMKTYAWMQATALSRIAKIKGDAKVRMFPVSDSLSIAFPRRDMSKCPAIMFAVSRTHNVIGRIKFLTSSIRTMKFIRAPGVPCGKR